MFVSHFFCFGAFFSHLIHMYNVIQIECCLEYLRFVHFMFDCGVKFVHATSTHGPFKRCDEEQKKKKILTNYFQICPAILESYEPSIGMMMSSAT